MACSRVQVEAPQRAKGSRKHPFERAGQFCHPERGDGHNVLTSTPEEETTGVVRNECCCHCAKAADKRHKPQGTAMPSIPHDTVHEHVAATPVAQHADSSAQPALHDGAIIVKLIYWATLVQRTHSS